MNTILFLYLLFAPGANARICGGFDFNASREKADLIFRGHLISRLPVGAPESNTRALFRVDKVLRGKTALPALYASYFLCDFETESGIHQGKQVILFFKGNDLVNDASIMSASNSIPQDDSSTDPLKREVIAAFEDRDPKIARKAIGHLLDLEGREALPRIRARSNDPDISMRTSVLGALAMKGDAEAFQKLYEVTASTTFRKHWGTSWTVNAAEDSAHSAFFSVLGTLESFGPVSGRESSAPKNNSERFAEIMVRFSKIDDAQIHRAAYRGLRGLNIPALYPALVVGLDDADEGVRHDSFFTLCLVMNSKDVPCRYGSKADQSIPAVKQWWAKRKH